MKNSDRLALLVAALCLAAPAPSVRAEDAAPAASIRYRLDRDARVSLHLSDASGRVVRELLHAAPRSRGRQAEGWDGLDEHGQPVPAGRYTWKLLATQGLRAEYLMTIGSNLEPPWEVMPGNHNGVTSVAVDDTGMYLSGGCSEGPPQIRKQTLDGRRLWYTEHVYDAWQGGHSAGVASGRLYELQGNGAIVVLDAATGRRLARWDVLWAKDDPAKDDAGYVSFMDLAVRGDQIVVAYKAHDTVRWLNPADGTVLAEAAVPAPQAVAVAPDGRVLVATSNAVVWLTRQDKTVRPLVQGLTAPWRIDAGGPAADLYVAEAGASQQVKRFSKDGAPLGTFGRAGGRQWGAYEPADFSSVRDLTADPHGGFIVCEGWGAPRRTALFDDQGRLRQEWYGGHMYANHAVVDPEDPTLVWADGSFGQLMQVKVDYSNRTWRVLATWNTTGLAEGMVWGFTHGGGRFQVRHHAGRTYLCRDDNEPAVLLVDEPGRRLVPMVASDICLAHDWDRTPAFIKGVVFPDHDRGKPWPNVGYDKTGHQSFQWTDGNDDGAPQPAEVKFDPFRGWDFGRFWPDEQMTYWMLYDKAVCAWPVRGWSPAGVPDYGGWSKLAAVADLSQAIDTRRFYHAGRSVWRCPDGTFFVAYNSAEKPFGMGFQSQDIGANRVLKVGADGRCQWVVGRHSPTLGAAPGEARILWRIAGAPHGCVAVTDMQCYYEERSLVHVWDADGLWVGRLLESPDTNVAPASAYALCTENFGGSLVEVTRERPIAGLAAGDVVFFGAGQNATPVFRITGWDTFRRQSGTVTLRQATAARLAAVAEADQTRADLARIPFVAPDRVKLDGDPAELTNAAPLLIRYGTAEVARVYLGWNATGISAAFDVATTRPWKTAASEPMAFTGGAAVDLMVGPPGAERVQPGTGDARYVAAPLAEGVRVVEFLPVMPAGMAAGACRPQTYRTEAQGVAEFAHVGALPPEACAARLKPDGSGYVVEMRVPLRAPLLLRPGERFRLDASVILAAADGARSEARHLWHSTSGDDRFVAADVVQEVRLRPAHWGEAVLE